MTLHYFSAILPFVAWLCSFLGTAIALSLLKQCQVIDMPNARSNHVIPVPRGGGIAMVISALLFLAAAGTYNSILVSCAFLALISFIDDMRGLPTRIRLITQIIAVTVSLYALHFHILPGFIPYWVGCIIIVLAWIWFINLTNFMDGIDGITSLEAIMVCIGVCLVSHTLALQACILAAATLGFYLYNRSPAKIFMGDIGSISLGFLLGYLLISLGAEGHLAAAFILPAYYVSDATYTLFKRLLRKEKIWQAHSQHAYQKAVRSGFSHTKTVRYITVLNAFLVVLAILSTHNMIAAIGTLVLAYILTVCLLYYFTNVTSSR
jgi:UDP-N-acetylmuramyl pentapeptide phosphotransferase/UDP-N-acetylglucosamine-1-phosphate transferase